MLNQLSLCLIFSFKNNFSNYGYSLNILYSLNQFISKNMVLYLFNLLFLYVHLIDFQNTIFQYLPIYFIVLNQHIHPIYIYYLFLILFFELFMFL